MILRYVCTHFVFNLHKLVEILDRFLIKCHTQTVISTAIIAGNCRGNEKSFITLSPRAILRKYMYIYRSERRMTRRKGKRLLTHAKTHRDDMHWQMFTRTRRARYIYIVHTLACVQFAITASTPPTIYHMATAGGSATAWRCHSSWHWREVCLTVLQYIWTVRIQTLIRQSSRCFLFVLCCVSQVFNKRIYDVGICLVWRLRSAPIAVGDSDVVYRLPNLNTHAADTVDIEA